MPNTQRTHIYLPFVMDEEFSIFWLGLMFIMKLVTHFETQHYRSCLTHIFSTNKRIQMIIFWYFKTLKLFVFTDNQQLAIFYISFLHIWQCCHLSYHLHCDQRSIYILLEEEKNIYFRCYYLKSSAMMKSQRNRDLK